MKHSLSFIFLLFGLSFHTFSLAQSTIVDTISIITFNDFHGAFVKEQDVPGAGVFVQTVLNEKQKHPNTIVVSAGDNFSGSYFSRITRGEPLPELFKIIGVEMSAVGNHEFDWGLSFLKDSTTSYIDYIAANITTNGINNPEWLKPYKIIERKLKNGATIRIAFIGLTTTETPKKSNPENMIGLEFGHPLGAASVQTLYELKKEGVIDMIILLTHIGTDMTDPDRITEADAKILPYMNQINAIITGHSHKIVLDKINNTPIIQAGTNGTHIGKLLFQVRENNGRVDVSFIQGDTIRASGKENPEIVQVVNKYITTNDFDKKLTSAKNNLIHDRNKNKFSYTSVGAYVTASYVHCFENMNVNDSLKQLPIIGVNHFGGIRTSIFAGDVTKLQAGNVLPFGGNITAYYFNGKRLKELLSEGRKNKNGYLQTSYLEISLQSDTITSISYIKDKQKIIIDDNTPCIVVLDSFITNGGDGYDESVFSGYEIEAFNMKEYETTSVFIDYLNNLKSISNEQAPLPVIRNTQ